MLLRIYEFGRESKLGFLFSFFIDDFFFLSKALYNPTKNYTKLSWGYNKKKSLSILPSISFLFYSFAFLVGSPDIYQLDYQNLYQSNKYEHKLKMKLVANIENFLQRLILSKFSQFALLRYEHPSPSMLFPPKLKSLLHKVIAFKFNQFALLRYEYPSALMLFWSNIEDFLYLNKEFPSLASVLYSGVSILYHLDCY